MSQRKKKTQKKAQKKSRTAKVSKKSKAKVKTKSKTSRKSTKKVNKKSAKKATKKKASKKVTKKVAKKKATKSGQKKVTKKAATKKAAKKSKKASSSASSKKATKKKSDTKVSLSIPKASVELGKKIPEFSLPATGGKTIRLDDLKGKKVVLFFYPKDATPGCTQEGHDFTRLYSKFKDQNTEVFGVSRDSLRSHEKFKEKQEYSVDLISDEDEKLCSIFGVIKLKNMYGRQVRGIERSTFLIDEEGCLKAEWRKVKVPEHAQTVLDSL